MSNDYSISRRKFLGAAAGAAGAAALGSWAPRAFGGPGAGVGERLVPPGKLGVQHFSIRDAITRRSIASSTAAGITPTMGHLGGPNFPDDPTDLGPLVPLPGGFIEVFEYLASVGYRGFEFFQYTQNINELGRQPTVAEIRSVPRQRRPGLRRHPHGWPRGDGRPGHAPGPDRHRPHAGAHDDRHGRRSGRRQCRQPARQLGGRGQQAATSSAPRWPQQGLRYYLHPEQNSFSFFNDPAHPELSRVHRIDWFVANTDP